MIAHAEPFCAVVMDRSRHRTAGGDQSDSISPSRKARRVLSRNENRSVDGDRRGPRTADGDGDARASTSAPGDDRPSPALIDADRGGDERSGGPRPNRPNARPPTNGRRRSVRYGIAALRERLSLRLRRSRIGDPDRGGPLGVSSCPSPYAPPSYPYTSPKPSSESSDASEGRDSSAPIDSSIPRPLTL